MMIWHFVAAIAQRSWSERSKDIQWRPTLSRDLGGLFQEAVSVISCGRDCPVTGWWIGKQQWKCGHGWNQKKTSLENCSSLYYGLVFGAGSGWRQPLEAVDCWWSEPPKGLCLKDKLWDVCNQQIDDNLTIWRQLRSVCMALTNVV